MVDRSLTMTRKGRPPLAEGHLENLSGSPRAKDRLLAILKTLSGEWTVPQAAAMLGICESRFHALRQQWMSEAIELLEPRPMGRPPRPHGDQACPPVAPEEVAALRRELLLAQTRLEIAQLRAGTAGKKNRKSQC
jgi:hypothetical protein